MNEPLLYSYYQDMSLKYILDIFQMTLQIILNPSFLHFYLLERNYFIDD